MADPISTNNTGIPVESDQYSLSVGPDGPILLQDNYLIEKMAQFNRERVPERVVHAKGSGAYGTFEVTNDVSQFTRADLFQPGRRTKMLARFSTVAGEQGSPDTWRDPRGFALKFYTQEGVYDLVGNNTPIFFMRDPNKFQDFIRSQKRTIPSGLRDNDMQWDYWTLSPESAHQVTYLMGDRGIPKTYRNMNGYGSHTYLWINGAGQRTWVKYHFHSDQGVDHMTDMEAAAMAGEDADHHRRDLFDAIERGEAPSWTLYVQTIPYEDAASYRYNIFDVTKTVPHSDYPLIEVGRMTLHTNPTDFFTHIEQAAFDPSDLVPGIGPSPDKMLQARLFSYADTHRYRVGTNYTQLPPNRTVNEVRSYAKDGAMRYFEPNVARPYAPNSYGGPSADEERWNKPAGWLVDSAEIVRSAYTLHQDDDDFSQPGTLVREVMDDAQRERLVGNVTRHLDNGVSVKVRERAFEYWRNIDPSVGDRIAASFG
ncbi:MULTISPECIES: catalase [Streptomyces]|uniref:Catalase n=1 Tax=Streptomyces evansiae TaxID=3075535 RepID=A0ABU2RAD5_9ACTN|nr:MULTISPECIES: catalase [unclassified Streptomyces]MYQ61454.1 catalase [Streptomyces sp. SID4926]MYR27743.1 catalase [Streptomyces sp. SID4945]MDT0413642.1 catalase [Streptomyces sp. DSM 41979]MDT0425806.1 catalase [Streptomyces sp. DSM 41859]WEH27947.1 catalase [Streptomyces sp. AM 3-1-1]